MRKISWCLILTSALAESQLSGAEAPVVLGQASSFGVLAGAGITNTGPTTIIGDVGTFPTTTMTGFGPVILTGTNHAGDGITQLAKSDLVTAFNDAASRLPTIIYAPIFDLGGLTLAPGVHTDSTSFGITGTLTLDGMGNPNAAWIFQTGSTLTTSVGSMVILINGAQAGNIFWKVGSSATLGVNSALSGTIMASSSISLNTGAKLDGHALALNGAVTLQSNAIAIVPLLVTFENALNLSPIPIQLTPNQTATVGALDSVLTDVRQAGVVAYLNGLNIAALPHQLDKIAPAQLTAIYSIGFAQLDTEILTVQQRLASIRNASWSEPTSSPNPTTSGKDVVSGGQISPTLSPDNQRYGFYVNATGQYASLGNTTNANGFDVQSVGSTIGADVRLNEHWVVGVTLGYARSMSDLSEGGRLTADGMRAAVYAMYLSGAFYTEFMAGGSYTSYDIQRSALGGMATGSTNSTSYDLYLGTGYNIQVNQWTFTPMASVRYTDVFIDSFTESGSLQPLHFGSQNQDSLRSRLGLRAAYTTLCGVTRITPSLSLQWQHEYLNSQLGITSQFANGAGNPFTVYGPKIGRDSALVTAGINFAWSRYAVYLAYQAELFRTNYSSHTMLAGFRVSW